ncbi:hypothetical protein JCM8202_000881 [Rhodotorula sphaerocarpa]
MADRGAVDKLVRVWKTAGKDLRRLIRDYLEVDPDHRTDLNGQTDLYTWQLLHEGQQASQNNKAASRRRCRRLGASTSPRLLHLTSAGPAADLPGERAHPQQQYPFVNTNVPRAFLDLPAVPSCAAEAPPLAAGLDVDDTAFGVDDHFEEAYFGGMELNGLDSDSSYSALYRDDADSLGTAGVKSGKNGSLNQNGMEGVERVEGEEGEEDEGEGEGEGEEGEGSPGENTNKIFSTLLAQSEEPVSSLTSEGAAARDETPFERGWTAEAVSRLEEWQREHVAYLQQQQSSPRKHGTFDALAELLDSPTHAPSSEVPARPRTRRQLPSSPEHRGSGQAIEFKAGPPPPKIAQAIAARKQITKPAGEAADGGSEEETTRFFSKTSTAQTKSKAGAKPRPAPPSPSSRASGTLATSDPSPERTSTTGVASTSRVTLDSLTLAAASCPSSLDGDTTDTHRTKSAQQERDEAEVGGRAGADKDAQAEAEQRARLAEQAQKEAAERIAADERAKAERKRLADDKAEQEKQERRAAARKAAAEVEKRKAAEAAAWDAAEDGKTGQPRAEAGRGDRTASGPSTGGTPALPSPSPGEQHALDRLDAKSATAAGKPLDKSTAPAAGSAHSSAGSTSSGGTGSGHDTRSQTSARALKMFLPSGASVPPASKPTAPVSTGTKANLIANTSLDALPIVRQFTETPAHRSPRPADAPPTSAPAPPADRSASANHHEPQGPPTTEPKSPETQQSVERSLSERAGQDQRRLDGHGQEGQSLKRPHEDESGSSSKHKRRDDRNASRSSDGPEAFKVPAGRLPGSSTGWNRHQDSGWPAHRGSQALPSPESRWKLEPAPPSLHDPRRRSSPLPFAAAASTPPRPRQPPLPPPPPAPPPAAQRPYPPASNTARAGSHHSPPLAAHSPQPTSLAAPGSVATDMTTMSLQEIKERTERLKMIREAQKLEREIEEETHRSRESSVDALRAQVETLQRQSPLPLSLIGAPAPSLPLSLARPSRLSFSEPSPLSLAGNAPLSLAGNAPLSLAGNAPLSLAGNAPLSLAGNAPLSLSLARTSAPPLPLSAPTTLPLPLAGTSPLAQSASAPSLARIDHKRISPPRRAEPYENSALPYDSWQPFDNNSLPRRGWPHRDFDPRGYDPRSYNDRDNPHGRW